MLYRRSATRWPARMLGLAAITATSLFLAVGTANAQPAPISNPAKITINDAGALNGSQPAKATPYPSDIAVTNVTGPISKLTVTLNGFSHSCTTDVDALLVAPDGLHRSILMSDAGDCAQATATHPDLTLTFDNAAGSSAKVPCFVDAIGNPMPGQTLQSGTYFPTDFLKGSTPGPTGACSSNNTIEDNFLSPGPGTGPFPADLATFNGLNATGTWHLYVVDEFKNDSGQIKNGWTLNVTITPPTVTAPAVTGTPQVGQALTAVSGQIANGGVASWQWNRCDGSGQSCSAIAGATQPTYIPAAGDAGFTMQVVETVTNSGGTDAKASAPTAAVAAPSNIQVPNQTKATLATRTTKTTQKVVSQGGLLASFTSNIDGNLVATATVSVPKLSKVYKFTAVRAKVVANNKTTVRLKLSKSALKAVKKALGKHKKLKAKLKLTVTTGSGAVTTVSKTVRLK